MVVRRLVVATKVAFVMVVCIMTALPVVVVVAIAAAWLAIFRIVAALLIGVLGLVAMDVARFARKLRQSFSLGLLAFVATVTRQFVAAITIVIVVINVTAWGAAFVSHVPPSVFVPALGRTPLRVRLFYGLAAQVEALVCHCSFNIVERFEILCDGFDLLINESPSRRDELITFGLMKSNIKPFKSEALVRHRNISCGD